MQATGYAGGHDFSAVCDKHGKLSRKSFVDTVLRTVA